MLGEDYCKNLQDNYSLSKYSCIVFHFWRQGNDKELLTWSLFWVWMDLFQGDVASFARDVFCLMISVSYSIGINYTMLEVVNVKEDSAKYFFEAECCPKCYKLG